MKPGDLVSTKFGGYIFCHMRPDGTVGCDRGERILVKMNDILIVLDFVCAPWMYTDTPNISWVKVLSRAGISLLNVKAFNV